MILEIENFTNRVTSKLCNFIKFLCILPEKSHPVPRRPSLGVEPTSPAPSADRLSVTFAMENVVLENVENEEEELEIDKGPISTILG